MESSQGMRGNCSIWKEEYMNGHRDVKGLDHFWKPSVLDIEEEQEVVY